MRESPAADATLVAEIPLTQQPAKDLTVLLNRASVGSDSAAQAILPLVYDELRALAAAKLRDEPKEITLQATALVHEAYVRLGGDADMRWESRRHYFGAAAEAMRRILIERARRYAGPKRGGGAKRVDLANVDVALGDAPEEWLALDEALTALQAQDPSLAELVSLRFFAGLSVDQIAMTQGVSPRTVDNHWKLARAFLARHIGGRASGE